MVLNQIMEYPVGNQMGHFLVSDLHVAFDVQTDNGLYPLVDDHLGFLPYFLALLERNVTWEEWIADI